jgi:hypothetical protein
MWLWPSPVVVRTHVWSGLKGLNMGRNGGGDVGGRWMEEMECDGPMVAAGSGAMGASKTLPEEMLKGRECFQSGRWVG